MAFFRMDDGQTVYHVRMTKPPRPCACPMLPGDNPACGDACGRPSVALCDFRIERRGVWVTCDRPMCEKHRKSVGENLDHCPCHEPVKP